MHLQTSRMVKFLATFITIMMQPIRVDAVLIPIGNLVAHMSLHVIIVIYFLLEHFAKINHPRTISGFSSGTLVSHGFLKVQKFMQKHFRNVWGL